MSQLTETIVAFSPHRRYIYMLGAGHDAIDSACVAGAFNNSSFFLFHSTSNLFLLSLTSKSLLFLLAEKIHFMFEDLLARNRLDTRPRCTFASSPTLVEWLSFPSCEPAAALPANISTHSAHCKHASLLWKSIGLNKSSTRRWRREKQAKRTKTFLLSQLRAAPGTSRCVEMKFDDRIMLRILFSSPGSLANFIVSASFHASASCFFPSFPPFDGWRRHEMKYKTKYIHSIRSHCSGVCFGVSSWRWGKL